MKKIVVASTNPVKIASALAGFKRMFPGEEFEVEGVSAASGVSDQPLTDAETFQGARNRAANACAARPDADYCVGMEGGLENKGDELEAFAWMVVRSRDGRSGKGRTGTFFLPPPVAALIAKGMELGQADDIVFGRTNSKQGQGAVGILTDGATDRARYYEEAMLLALMPFKNPALYEVKVGEKLAA